MRVSVPRGDVDQAWQEDEAKALSVGTLTSCPNNAEDKSGVVRFEDPPQNGTSNKASRDPARKDTGVARLESPASDAAETADPLPQVKRGKVRKGTGFVKKEMQPPSEDEDEDEDQ